MSLSPCSTATENHVYMMRLITTVQRPLIFATYANLPKSSLSQTASLLRHPLHYGLAQLLSI